MTMQQFKDQYAIVQFTVLTALNIRFQADRWEKIPYALGALAGGKAIRYFVVCFN